MIALCATCHNHADGNSFSKEYLHKLKKASPSTPPKGNVPWKLDKMLIIIGGNYFYALRPQFALRFLNQTLFSLERDDNRYFLINANIINHLGDSVAKIENNDILIDPKIIGDFKCTVQSKKINIISKQADAKIELSLHKKKIGDLVDLFMAKKNSNPDRDILKSKTKQSLSTLLDEENLIPTLEINLKFFTEHLKINTNKSGIYLNMTHPLKENIVLTGKNFQQFALNVQTPNKEILFMGSW